LLEAAGLKLDVEPSTVAEGRIRHALESENGLTEPAHLAEVLARAKAEDVSQLRPDALVIGGDQVLALGAMLLSKPQNIDEARAMLLEMRGRTHELHSSVALARRGEVMWTATETAELKVRSFSKEFLEDYLSRTREMALASVGAYQIEGLGVQLFENVRGDYFTILGLPLIPLLEELRRRDVLLT
jgi:septum formation protein